MRVPPLELREGDREVLQAWCRAGTVEARVAKRARIVLLAADGCSNREIGRLVDMHYNQVAIWRRRYSEFGLAGSGDLERSGRPCVYGHDDVLLLVKLVTEEPPDGATRWTMEALAEAMAAHGVPISTLCRRRHNLDHADTYFMPTSSGWLSHFRGGLPDGRTGAMQPWKVRLPTGL